MSSLNNVTTNVLRIINKHRSSLLQVVYLHPEKNVLRTHKGILKNLSESTIQLSAEGTPTGYMNLKFVENGKKKIYAIYNKNFSELLSLRNVETLNKKLRDSENQKFIISKIKPQLGKEVSIVFKKMDIVQVSTGQFADMGISDISIKPAPFYNTTERLAYNSILNIYDNIGFDLLELPRKPKENKEE